MPNSPILLFEKNSTDFVWISKLRIVPENCFKVIHQNSSGLQGIEHMAQDLGIEVTVLFAIYVFINQLLHCLLIKITYI